MAGGGGGKGDKQSSTIRLPKEIEALAKRNLAAAEKAGKIGFVPYEGPTVGALHELQIGAMEQNEAARNAFGMGGGPSVRSTIPTPTTYAGGIQGYDPMALYLQSLDKIDPAQRAAIESFFNPQGVTAANAAGTARPGGKGGIPNPMTGGGLDMYSLGYKNTRKGVM